jgi:thiol-disulfide isomerase/thioredoxin
VISFRGADCVGCLEGVAAKLKKEPGVHDVSLDRRRAQIAVVAAPSFDALTSAKRHSEGEEFELLLGAGKGSYLPWANSQEGADVKVVSEDGRDVPDLNAVLVKGKVTVVDFSALWCEPCRELDAHLLEVVAARDDVAYRKLEVGDWDTPLAERYLKGVKELPYVIVYDKQGKKVAAIQGLDIAGIDAAIEKGAE